MMSGEGFTPAAFRKRDASAGSVFPRRCGRGP
jgi:hypothetical protein